eukprot:7099629-Lingulodinium_polyedra.AAC.1
MAVRIHSDAYTHGSRCLCAQASILSGVFTRIAFALYAMCMRMSIDVHVHTRRVAAPIVIRGCAARQLR